MRSVVLRSLAVIGLGAAVLVGVLYVASTVDARAPEVLEIRLTQPLADDPARALITTSLEVVFNEEVEPDGAIEALLIDPVVEGTVSWSGATLIFTPSDPLELETTYTVTLDDGVTDAAGNEMATLPEPFVFETAGRPSVVEAEPADGSADVTLDSVISLRFSTLMDTASVEGALQLSPAFAYELRWSGELLEIVPDEPLRPDEEYELSVGGDAADIAGVQLGAPVRLTFRTLAPGLAVEALVPADGIDGVATSTPIAIIFDRRVDAGTVSGDLLVIEPAVAGTLDVIGIGDAPVDGEGNGHVIRFEPSGPLPSNTTFAVTLLPGVATIGGGGLTDATTWTFTTGAPTATISNQVVFLSERSGVANVWAMNPDGTGQRQISSELNAVVDYEVAPDGSSLVVGDGRELVFVRPDGSERRVLTEEGAIEFDPAFAPNGDRLAFARADAETGDPLGLWEWQVGGGPATPIEIPDDTEGASPSPSPESSAPLRAPRYAPDGEALAFVGLEGWVGIIELPAERMTRVAFRATAPPAWLPDSSLVLLTGLEDVDGAVREDFTIPVLPLAPDSGEIVVRLARSGTSLAESPFGVGARVVAIGADGSIAYVDADAALWRTDLPNTVTNPPLVDDARVLDAAFAPGDPAMVIVIDPVGDRPGGPIERLEIATGERTPLVDDGWLPRWLP